MVLIDFVTDVYRQINILAEFETPTAEQGSVAVTRLNDLMASLAEDGINLGYNPKTDTSDTIDFPLGHIMGIKAMLGVLLAQDNDLPIPTLMAALSDASYNRLLKQSLYASMQPSTMRHIARGDAQYVFNRGYIISGESP